MTLIKDEKKTEFWQTLSTEPKPSVLTVRRMAKLRVLVWDDVDFWNDIVVRHNGLKMTAAELKMCDPAAFDHCVGNFHGMLVQTLYSMC